MCFSFYFFFNLFCSPLLASEVVFIKMPSRQQQRKAKRREVYLQNRDEELESSRVRYNTDAEQRRASAHESYRADPGKMRASARESYRPDPEKKRASVRNSYRTDHHLELNRTSKRRC